MKKILTAVICTTLTVLAANTASAQQKGDMAWGVQGAYTSLEGYPDNVSFIGLGAKFRYNVMDPLRLEASFTYYLPKDEMSLWDFSADAQWLFPVSDKITLYPAAGLGMYGVKVDIPTVDLGEFGSYGGGSASDSEFGLNIGGGADFRLSEKTAITAQLKYSTALERIMISAGVAFTF